MAYEVEAAELQPQQTAVVRGHVEVDEIPGFLAGVFGEVIQTLSAQGLAASGPPFSRYGPTGDGFDVEAGFPSSGPVRPQGRVVAGELPGGSVARVQHTGDYAGVALAYDAAMQWVAAQGLTPAGPPWESYLDGPEVAQPRTVVCVPCHAARARQGTPASAGDGEGRLGDDA